MKNDSSMGGVKISVPPTLLVSAIGQIADVRDAVTLDPKQAGDVVFLLGTTFDETGGSEYFRHRGTAVGNKVPRLDPEAALRLYLALELALGDRLVRSAATPALGGWGLTFARSAIAGGFGLELDLDRCPEWNRLDPDVFLFSESNARFLITTAANDADAFGARFEGLACHRVGQVTTSARLVARAAGRTLLDLAIPALSVAFKETLQDD